MDPMPTRITACFQALRSRGEKALIPYLTAGDPDLQTTFEALQVLDQHGADLIELGVPYSDPLADGPVIQAAASRALRRGVTLGAILQGLQGLSLQAPLILFTYYNPIYQLGIPTFVQQLRRAGCAGLVVPDLPLEEAEPLREATQAEGIDLILLVAPTSPPERMRRIAQHSSGFVYLVSTTGVTGERSTLEQRLPALLQQLRQSTSLPIGVGFGISTPEQARQIALWGADAAIVGSAFVQRLTRAPTPAQGLQQIASLLPRSQGCPARSGNSAPLTAAAGALKGNETNIYILLAPCRPIPCSLDSRTGNSAAD
jgi:tryptophan synthase alpha chain